MTIEHTRFDPFTADVDLDQHFATTPIHDECERAYNQARDTAEPESAWDTIEEQVIGWKSWALALAFAILAVYAGCAWLVNA